MKKFIVPALVAAGCCFAGELTVKVTTDKPSGIYKSGEVVKVTAVALEDGKPVSGRTVTYDLIADGKFRKRGKFVSDAAKPFVWKHKLAYPAALRAEFTILDANGKRVPLKRGYDQVRYAGGRIGAVSDPEKILPAGKRPADFDAFWQKQKARLAKVPMKLLEKKSLEKRLSHAMKAKSEVWDIKVSCVDNVPVSGVLAMPKNAKTKSHPAILLVPGAGVSSIGVYNSTRWSEKGAICLDINAHGIPNFMPAKFYQDLRKGKLKSYYSMVYPDREKHVFVNMALRMLRALEYLRSLPEWDGKNLILRGASQGGWHAITGSGLDNKVTLCLAGVPAFADFDGEFAPVQRMERMHFGLAIRNANRKNGADVQKLLKAQSYFDPVHFAGKIKCPTYISVGFVDLSCPTTSVYAIYNSLPGNIKKGIQSHPAGVHATSPNKIGDAELNKLLKGMKK